MSDLSKDSVKSNRVTIRKIAITAIFTAMAVVLMYLEIPLPFMPVFLKFDFSEIPVLIGSFSLGPVYGVMIELLKNILHLPNTQTMGIGELSNFITGSIYVLTAGFFYEKHRTRKGAVKSMLLATAALAVFAVPFNYFFTLPIYDKMIVPMDAIIGMTNAVNSLVHNKVDLILWAFLPFNLFKGLIVSFITFWIYKPISKLINSTYKKTR
ncbi:MAG: ECF transporter S component [Clostridiales bacterium]|nr:ECF transporter S component [Clostridiales bacterium]